MGAENKLKFERDEEGFVYIDSFLHALEQYKNNRAQYKSLEDYFPELVKELEKIK